MLLFAKGMFCCPFSCLCQDSWAFGKESSTQPVSPDLASCPRDLFPPDPQIVSGVWEEKAARGF